MTIDPRLAWCIGAGSLLALAVSAAGCGDEAEAAVPLAEGIAPDVEGELDLPPPPEGIAPAHGGTILAAGPYPMEVVATPAGEVEAYFAGPSGPPPDAVVSVRVPTDAGPRPVMLTWDPERNAYRGSVRNATVAPGPVDVRVVVAGTPYRGRAPQLVIVAPSAPAAAVVVARDGDEGFDEDYDDGPLRGAVIVEGAPPPRPAVVVERPRATVVVEHPTPPRPTVVVEHPRPRPGVVVVEHPRPRPGVVVVEHPRPRPGVVVVEGRRGRGRRVRAHGPGHGRGHGRGRRR